MPVSPSPSIPAPGNDAVPSGLSKVEDPGLSKVEGPGLSKVEGFRAGSAPALPPSGTEVAQHPLDDIPLIEPLCAIFRRFLKRQGLKFTPERAFILDAVLSKPGVFEAEELLADMRASPHRVSKATIYRTLKHLVEARIITQVLIDAKQAHYQLSFGQEPRAYLVNLQTNRIIEVDCPELQTLRDRLCREHGLTPVSHRLVVYAKGDGSGMDNG